MVKRFVPDEEVRRFQGVSGEREQMGGGRR
jgi:hypothetical protein